MEEVHTALRGVNCPISVPPSSSPHQQAYLEQFVLLAEFNGLSPAVVHSEEVGTDATELKELVFLHLLGQSDHVKVVESIDGFSQSFVVFFLNQNLPAARDKQ